MRSSCLIVLNYNDADTTISFLESVVGIAALSHIVVVDNYSTDDSYERIKEYTARYNADCPKPMEDKGYQRVHVIRSEKNGGYAYGNNLGCRYAIERFSPDVLFISNPDTRFDEATVSRMAEVLRSQAGDLAYGHLNSDNGTAAALNHGGKGLAVVAPVVNQGYNAWSLPDYFGVLCSIFLVMFNLKKKRLKSDIITASRKGDDTAEEVFKVGVAEGSFFAVLTGAFEAVGGFDERTFLYYEESILAKRLSDAGYSEAIIPSLSYDHFHSISVSKVFGSKARAFKNFKTGMRLYLKDYLKTGFFGMLFFEICFAVGYLERIVFDLFGGYRISRRVGKTDGDGGNDK